MWYIKAAFPLVKVPAAEDALAVKWYIGMML
jgi:hypothetical protein